MRNMTPEEFSHLVAITEDAVSSPVKSEIAEPRKSNGMSEEMSAFLDSLSSPSKMEATVQAIIAASNPINA